MLRKTPRLQVALLLVPALSLLPALLAAQRDDDADWQRHCGRWAGRDRESFCEVRVSGYKPKAGVITVIPDDNGGVEAIGWDKDSVEIHARIQAQDYSESDAKALVAKVRVTTQGNDISVDGPDTRRHSGWSVMFVVYVPAHSDLSLESVNGPIDVDNVNGVLRLRTENGPLYLSRVAGDVHGRSQNGPVTVALDGDKWTGAGLDVASDNGPAELAVPRDYNANLEFGTVNGPMTVGFPISVTLNGSMSRRINTTLGSGGPTIRVVSTNGPFTLERAGRLER